MEPVLIPCPKCGKELKLRDRKLLGRRGKCPKCEHRFVLQEPEEVELELAEQPAMGTSATWVPDEPAAAPSSAVATATRRIEITTDDKPAPGTTRSKAAERRRKQRQMKMWIIGGSCVSGMLLAVVLWWAFGTGGSKGTGGDAGSGDKTSQNGQQQTQGNGSNAKALSNIEFLEKPSPPPEAPPSGGPIELTGIPLGARMVIHLRPKDLRRADDVRACLGSRFVEWFDGKLKELLLFEPEKIEEALICLFLDVKTEAPRVAYWVKLTEPQKPSEFIARFKGRPDSTTYPRKIYIQDEPNGRAFMIIDREGQVFASAPAAFAGDMVSAAEVPSLPSGGLEQLLKRTDRNRHLTVVFNPHDIDDFKEYFFPKDAFSLVQHFLDRLESEKVESAAWSFYFGSPQYPDFYSELVLRTRTSITPRELQVDMHRKLSNLPDEVLTAVKHMHPKRQDQLKLVGRFPIMLKAFDVETVSVVGSENERYVKLITALPKIAGPNLAAAGMLTWELAASTDFSKPPPKTGGSKKIPARIADRLKLKIDVDFRRLPLQEAFDYIGTEAHIKTSIDGDALKDSGFTKNMPQTFKLGEVTAEKTIATILKQYKGMVIVVDEDKKQMILTTEKFAKMKGQKPYPVKP